MTTPPPSRVERRFERQFKALSKQFPAVAGPLRAMRNPMLWLVRLPLAIILILGGFLAVLPFFGLWMIPVGLLLLAVDVPRLKGPVAAAMIRIRRRLTIWRKKIWR